MNLNPNQSRERLGVGPKGAIFGTTISIIFVEGSECVLPYCGLPNQNLSIPVVTGFFEKRLELGSNYFFSFQFIR
jgi:hypothetical protein